MKRLFLVLLMFFSASFACTSPHQNVGGFLIGCEFDFEKNKSLILSERSITTNDKGRSSKLVELRNENLFDKASVILNEKNIIIKVYFEKDYIICESCSFENIDADFIKRSSGFKESVSDLGVLSEQISKRWKVDYEVDTGEGGDDVYATWRPTAFTPIYKIKLNRIYYFKKYTTYLQYESKEWWDWYDLGNMNKANYDLNSF